MDDLISRQAALNIRFSDAINEDGVLYVPFRDFSKGLKALPSADVVEIVRCKDCKWWDNDGDAERCTHKYGGMWAKSDAYCSYGERKEG